MSLFAELKRRNVFRVGIAYVVLAWIILQVGDTMAPALHLPEWINSALAFFVILGFPLAIFFAWAFEMTPEGLKLEKDVDRDASITPTTGRKLDRTIIVMLVVALGYFIWQSQKAPTEEITEAIAGRESIAVLPFENMSSDDEQEYFSDGLTEELLNLLAKIPELKVTSRTSAFFYKDKDIKISDIGKELDVDHILEGSVRKSGKKIRITAQLIEVDSDAHLWSDTWDRDLDDVFVIQDEIAAAVVNELKVQLLGDLPHAVTANAEAYSLFLQARHTVNQRTHESLLRGEDIVQHAIDLDPDYAPAWVLKAYILSQQADVGARLPQEVLAQARAAVDKALQLDPNSSAAYALSGDLMVSFERDFEGAKAAIEKALELDPYDIDTLYQASVFYGFTGDFEEGLRLAQITHEFDPLHVPNHATLGYIYNALGRFEEAKDILRQRIEISPESFGSYAYLGNVYFFEGNYEEALRVYEQERLDGFKYVGQAVAHYHMGNVAASDVAFARLKALQTGGWDWQVVQVHAARGELDEAFVAMDLAYENRDSGLGLILGDRHIENLRSDPRYEAMVEKLGIRLATD